MSWNLEEAIGYYQTQGAPSDQSALVNLLREVQQENGGGIPRYMLGTVADTYGVKESYLLALIKRIPRLRLEDSHCLEICAGPNCGKRARLAEFAQAQGFAGKITIKQVPCMRMCGKGPNIKWDGTLYHQADEALLRRLMEKI